MRNRPLLKRTTCRSRTASVSSKKPQRGFSEGSNVGQQQAKAELQPVLDQLGKSLATLSSLRSRIRSESEGDLLKLSISIARRVLHRELTLDPESIEGLIRVALEKLQSRELSRIRVHPDQEQLKTLMEQAGLERVEYFNLSAGVVALHRGYRL